jgi:hypothetical protein
LDQSEARIISTNQKPGLIISTNQKPGFFSTNQNKAERLPQGMSYHFYIIHHGNTDQSTLHCLPKGSKSNPDQVMYPPTK